MYCQKYNINTSGNASRTGDYWTDGRNGKAERAGTGETSGTGGTGGTGWKRSGNKNRKRQKGYKYG